MKGRAGGVHETVFMMAVYLNHALKIRYPEIARCAEDIVASHICAFPFLARVWLSKDARRPVTLKPAPYPSGFKPFLQLE